MKQNQEVTIERQRVLDERADRKASYDWWWHKLKLRDPEKGADLPLVERMAIFAAEDEAQRRADQLEHDAYMERWKARPARRRAQAAVAPANGPDEQSPDRVGGSL